MSGDGFFVELPGGAANLGEDLEKAARSELLEKVGAEAQELTAFPPHPPLGTLITAQTFSYIALGTRVTRANSTGRQGADRSSGSLACQGL